MKTKSLGLFMAFIVAIIVIGCTKSKQANSAKVESENTIKIPFEMYRNTIRMKGKVNKKDVYVLLDNGSLWDELMFFGSPEVDALKLEKTDSVILGDTTVANPIIADVDTNINLTLANLKFENQKAIITRYIPGLPNLWEGADCQISAALFKNYVVEVNFDENYLLLTPPDEFNYTGNGQVIDMKPGPHNSRLINAEIEQTNGTKVSIDLLVDLGGIHPLYLPIGKRDDIVLPEHAVESVLGKGFRTITGHIGRIKSVRFGKYKVDDVLTAFKQVDTLADEYGNTMIGIKLLKQFNVTFDYPHEKIILEPSKNFNQHMVFNTTGIEFKAMPDGNLSVTKIYPDSPAEKAGILPNDIVTHMNHFPVKDFRKGEIKNILAKEGQTVTFTIESAGKIKESSITLKEIL